MRALIKALLVLNALDAALTLVWSRKLGTGYEANPLMAWCLTQGPWVFLAMKLGVFSALLCAVELLARPVSPKALDYTLGALVGAYIAVVFCGVLGVKAALHI